MIEEQLAAAHRYFAAAPSRTELWRARWEGRRDGRSAIPAVQDVRPGGRLPAGNPPEVSTSFTRIAQQDATAAVTKLVGLAREYERPLFVRLGSQAERVNREYENGSSVDSVARERFHRSATELRGLENIYWAHAKGAKAFGDRLIETYWGPLVRHHPYLSGARKPVVDLAPRLVVIDDSWPGNFGLEEFAKQYPYIRRALEIVGWYGPRGPRPRREE
jgi:hypothetical protein